MYICMQWNGICSALCWTYHRLPLSQWCMPALLCYIGMCYNGATTYSANLLRDLYHAMLWHHDARVFSTNHNGLDDILFTGRQGHIKLLGDWVHAEDYWRIPCVMPSCPLVAGQYIWGQWCQKQVSQAGISNCIPQNTVGCNYLFLPETPASGPKVLIFPKYLQKTAS